MNIATKRSGPSRCTAFVSSHPAIAAFIPNTSAQIEYASARSLNMISTTSLDTKAVPPRTDVQCGLCRYRVSTIDLYFRKELCEAAGLSQKPDPCVTNPQGSPPQLILPIRRPSGTGTNPLGVIA